MHMLRSSARTWLLGLVLGLGSAAAGAATIRIALDFSAPVLTDCADGTTLVEVSDCVSFNDPGLPVLPARGATVLLPPGEQVAEVRAQRIGVHVVEGRHRVPPAQSPRPISAPGPFPATPADPGVYGRDDAYPAAAARLVTTQGAWGHGLAFLRVHPVRYRPLSGGLEWCERIEIEVRTEPSPGADPGQVPRLRDDDRVRQRLARWVANPGDFALYDGCRAAPVAGSRLDPDYVPYVIVTTEAFAPGFDALAAFQSSRGLRARVVLLSSIAGDYPGVDLAEQLRAFVIDAYQNWQTDYVLLGGDLGVVPVRNLYVDAGGTIDAFPGDCYYEGLDGTWNPDGDDRWGEDGEFDLVGEIAVGRASIDDETQLARWLHKNAMYTERPVVGEIAKALFLGEQLDANTYGDDSMDEVKDYACTHGYCTSGYPNDYVKATLYDRDHAWSGWEAIQLFNSGFPTSHHLGHSGTTYNMKMSNGDVQYFTNDGVAHSYLFPSTQGCYANNFDSNAPDAISEVFLYDEHAAAAFLGCTRYGWYVPGTTAGPSQHFDRQFVDACYAEGLASAGRMNVDSKVDCIWMLNPWMLWCHYELCLLGDPALPQWRSCEGELELVHEGGLVQGQADYAVLVRAAGFPVPGATVTVYADDQSVWASGVSGPDGTLQLHPSPPQPMTLRLKAVKADYLPAADSLVVAPPTGPCLVLSEVALDDDPLAPSAGNGDGLADAGETLQLLLELHNVGADPATNVSVELACDDPRVTLIDAGAGYGTLAPGARRTNADDLVAAIDGQAPDGGEVWIELTVTADGRPTWHSGFRLGLHAPILALSGWEIDDAATGDGEGDADPGEAFALRVTLANAGSGEARELTALLSCGSGFVQLEQAESGCPQVPAGGAAELAPPFAAALHWSAPTDSVLHFSLQVTTAYGQASAMGIDVPVASVIEDDFESESGWHAGLPGDNATAGAWVRVDPVGTRMGSQPAQPEDDHTPLGAECFVTGQGVPGQSALLSDVDGGRTTLLSPPIDLTGAHRPRLVYWRWFTNHLGTYPGEDAWRVDISDDGGLSWVALENTTASQNEWRRMEFDLESYVDLTDRVLIRFVASDLGGDSLVEAAVDDLAIETAPVDPSDAPVAPPRPVAFGLRAPAPSPFPAGGDGAQIAFGLSAAGPVTLRVFDVGGRLVRTLVQGARPAGEHRVAWDGRDAAGAVPPSGIYFLRLQADGQESRARLVVVR
jgi:hypothetical protein